MSLQLSTDTDLVADHSTREKNNGAIIKKGPDLSGMTQRVFVKYTRKFFVTLLIRYRQTPQVDTVTPHKYQDSVVSLVYHTETNKANKKGLNEKENLDVFWMDSSRSYPKYL